MGVTRRRGGFPPIATTRGGGFGGNGESGVGFFGTGCGWGFLGVVWGCFEGQKMEAFLAGMRVGVPTGSWKNGVSSARVGFNGQKGKAFLARGCCRQGTTTMRGKN